MGVPHFAGSHKFIINRQHRDTARSLSTKSATSLSPPPSQRIICTSLCALHSGLLPCALCLTLFTVFNPVLTQLKPHQRGPATSQYGSTIITAQADNPSKGRWKGLYCYSRHRLLCSKENSYCRDQDKTYSYSRWPRLELFHSWCPGYKDIDQA